MTDGRKTLARITRQLVEPRDIYAVADVFRQSPWTAEVLRPPVRAYVLAEVGARLATVPPERRCITISLDDTTCHTPRSSRGFEPVDWHGDSTDHTAGVGPQGQRYAYGLPVVTCRISVGEVAYIVDWRVSMLAQTVRRLTRQRPRGQRLAFRSTTHVAREMLAALAPISRRGVESTSSLTAGTRRPRSCDSAGDRAGT
jgi:hypothetical protein